MEQTNARAPVRRETSPIAVAARYDRRIGRIVVAQSSAFPPRLAQGLENAKPAEVSFIEISPADLYPPALLEGLLGSKRWITARLGKSRSAPKTAASR